MHFKMVFFKKVTNLLNKLPLVLFILSIAVLIFGYGLIVAKYKLFPYSYLKTAIVVAKEFRNKAKNKKPWYYPKTNCTKKLSIYKKNEVDSALILFCSMSENNSLSAKVIDRQGNLVHEWKIDWFDIYKRLLLNRHRKLLLLLNLYFLVV